MLKIYPHQKLGHADHGWLDTRHHFSFADYHNPERMHFGKLRVINDDIIQPGTGFGMHGHRDMEIITFVRSGAITHRDSRGNEGRTTAGDVQVMSAGIGIFHSEHNLESEDTVIFQIWIVPDKCGITPRWDLASYAHKQATTTLPLLVSGRAEHKATDALFINQDAAIYGGKLQAGQSLQQAIVHQAYVLVSSGQVEVDGQTLQQGDGAEVTQQALIQLRAVTDSEVILIDVPD